jgi:hypothetical protein
MSIQDISGSRNISWKRSQYSLQRPENALPLSAKMPTPEREETRMKEMRRHSYEWKSKSFQGQNSSWTGAKPRIC